MRTDIKVNKNGISIVELGFKKRNIVSYDRQDLHERIKTGNFPVSIFRIETNTPRDYDGNITLQVIGETSRQDGSKNTILTVKILSGLAKGETFNVGFYDYVNAKFATRLSEALTRGDKKQQDKKTQDTQEKKKLREEVGAKDFTIKKLKEMLSKKDTEIRSQKYEYESKLTEQEMKYENELHEEGKRTDIERKKVAEAEKVIGQKDEEINRKNEVIRAKELTIAELKKANEELSKRSSDDKLDVIFTLSRQQDMTLDKLKMILDLM